MRTLLSSVAMLLLVGHAVPSLAQSPDATRAVGYKGATQVGFGFNVQLVPNGGKTTGTYNGQVDIGKFATERLVLRAGSIVSGQVGGFSPFGGSNGSVTSVSGLTGLLFYATPNRMSSAYFGADYLFQLTNRGQSDAGFLYGRFGVQSALRPNTALYMEAGYGQSVRDFGSAGSISGQLGLRLLF